ncbi:MAG TPA: gamma-glutamyl-gamma-aminobutyrate hydrolase family protein [Gaiellaceae bacterium]|nr:gamma-glutamyl-gamma-aminobutyrate hydrolase family protein [Gaiellaceae bacterium]
MKPVIGVTSFVEGVSWGHWSSPAAVTPFAYVRAVSTAGGRPVQLPPDDDAVGDTLDRLDGLVATGGIDIDPALYGGDEHPTMAGARPEQDRAEMALLEAALARNMPVLAICRGSQLLNVLRGGDIVQDLAEGNGSPDLHGDGTGTTAEHEVTVREGSRLAGLLGGRSSVTSEHHQALGRIGAGLDEVAWAADGTVEALEDPAKRFALGVPWHPERSESSELFRGLVAEARRYREAQG